MPNLSRPGDVELHFEERGDGPLVVLAPYWSGQPDVYEGFLSDLSRDHSIVTWDARGTGESTHGDYRNGNREKREKRERGPDETGNFLNHGLHGLHGRGLEQYSVSSVQIFGMIAL